MNISVKFFWQLFKNDKILKQVKSYGYKTEINKIRMTNKM